MNGYLIRLALFVGAAFLGLCSVNLVANPYGYFDVPKIGGVNESALGFNHRLPLAKALAVDKRRPATVVLGNSRAETGYDPEHQAILARPAYNLAVGGATIQTVCRYALEALATGELRHLIVAVDFTMFDPANWKEAIDDSAFVADDEGQPRGLQRSLARLSTALLSGTALSDSWWSMTHQNRPVARYRPSGMRDDAYDMAQVVREGGHRAASLRTESDFLAVALRDLRSSRARQDYGRAMHELKRVVELASSRGVRVTLVFNPIHARQSYLFATSGLWQEYERWKYDLVAAVDSVRGAEVWDFSGVSECTSEPLPARETPMARMRWYRETSHFRHLLGDKVLERIAGDARSEECRDLGYRLNTGNASDVLSLQRTAMSRWVAAHPDDVVELDTLARLYGRRS